MEKPENAAFTREDYITIDNILDRAGIIFSDQGRNDLVELVDEAGAAVGRLWDALKRDRAE
jgi:hypothetical protein